MQVWDSIRSVRCLWEGNLNKAVSVALSVGMLSQEIVTFSGDTATARLDIQMGRGPFAPAATGLVKIGELMTLVVTVEGDPAFNVLVRSCIARDNDPNSGNMVQLTDDRGCNLKPKLMGAIQTARDPNTNAVIAYAIFRAFKFPDVMDLTIECNVELCKTECAPCPDPNQILEPNRRRRSADNSTLELTDPVTVGRRLRVFLPEDLEESRQSAAMVINVGSPETNLTSMEAKTEALLKEEEKYLNKIERLHEELEQTSQQLVKSKQTQLDLQQIFEEHDINQNQMFTKQLNKINELEKINVTLTKKLKNTQEINNLSRKPLSSKHSETQTCNEPSLSTTSILRPQRISSRLSKTLSQTTPEEDKSISRDTFRTLHSFLINSTHHIQKGNSYRRVIIDEALMLHAGEILFAAILAKTQEIMLIGDINQIPYINRTGNFEVKFHKISEIAVITKELNITYRCTRSATAILSGHYPQGMMTTSGIEGEMKQQLFDTLESLQHTIDKNKHTCLVFKQSEKRELIKLGFRTSTIHEFQGRQAEDIVIVRTSTKPEDIYNSTPHCLVGVTRHTRSFLYISPNTDDTLSNWIRKANSQQLLNCTVDKEAENSPPPKEDRVQNNFLAKIQFPKEKHKLQLKKKPLMFWNSLYKKIKKTRNPEKLNQPTRDSNSPLPTKT
ncbi:hypothetical protein J6590_033002 [Homalodisca vitripennis]|nr:hypothetical protein J6590_033002 [Homalodisca vitripennis]